MRSGEYPKAFNRGASAIVQVAPWMIAYNSEKLKGADVPRDWPDLLKPHLKGQILLANPAASSAYLDFWVLAVDKYGADFFKKLLAQNPRQYPGGVPAVQALGAGEGTITLPVVPAQVEATRGKGAPLATQVIDLTSGVEMQVILTVRSKSKAPATARLMAHYVMTREGNTVYNDDPGGMTVYDTGKLPKLYQSPKLATAARKDEIAKLLGF
jgi:iron(III) transport system substrate-binding protein